MVAIGTVLFTALITFTATNIDDIFVLMIFFSQVDSSLRPWHIVVGQYLGFCVLLAVSMLGFFGSLFIPQPWIGLLGLAPIFLGTRRLFQRSPHKQNSEQITRKPTSSRTPYLATIPSVYSVAAVTFANGGDNLGVYIPLFGSQKPFELAITLCSFLVLIAVWCYLGHRVSQLPAVDRVLSRYGHILVPMVLISLGLYIMLKSGTLTLLGM